MSKPLRSKLRTTEDRAHYVCGHDEPIPPEVRPEHLQRFLQKSAQRKCKGCRAIDELARIEETRQRRAAGRKVWFEELPPGSVIHLGKQGEEVWTGKLVFPDEELHGTPIGGRHLDAYALMRVLCERWNERRKLMAEPQKAFQPEGKSLD